MISFDDARRIVEEAGINRPDRGTYYVSPDGFEDAEAYNVLAGAREWIVDRSENFLPRPGGTEILVSKKTGKITRTVYVADRARFKAMTPCHSTAP